MYEKCRTQKRGEKRGHLNNAVTQGKNADGRAKEVGQVRQTTFTKGEVGNLDACKKCMTGQKKMSGFSRDKRAMAENRKVIEFKRNKSK